MEVLARLLPSLYCLPGWGVGEPPDDENRSKVRACPGLTYGMGNTVGFCLLVRARRAARLAAARRSSSPRSISSPVGRLETLFLVSYVTDLGQQVSYLSMNQLM